ncbi:MAG: VWA domain-containing protein [Verrucomicrobia bacterium]|nr:VWA domain-containing protein [Verrucomicrobiota bacterium]
MSFLAPAALIFAATLPVVVIFYLLKRKRVVRLVSSTLLWQKFLAETQANAPFQKLRHNWLLILQLLLLALVVFALARPFLGGMRKPSQLRVLILDGSASMQATDEKPTRFDRARSEALKWVDGLTNSPGGGSSDQMVVLLAGANTEVKQSATSDKQALRRALASCAAADAPTRLTEALKLAETLVQNQANAEIHLFSDGAAPELGEFENKNLPLTYHRIGVRCENFAIVTADVRANPDDATQRAVFVTVANFSTNAQSTELELRFDEQIVEVRPLKLEAKQSTPLVFAVNQPRDGTFRLHLTATDDLAADNDAALVSLLPQPVKVLLVSRGNRFLEKALRAAGNVQLSTAASLTDSAKAFDLVVLDDVQPVEWPEANVLAIHVANTNWFGAWQRVESPGIVDWKNTHPVLRAVSLDNVQVAEALAVKPPPWAVALVDSPSTPLVLAGERGQQRIVWVAFDTLQSTWPLRVSFPIFVANAVQWLDPAAARNSRLNLRAGEPFRLTLTEPAKSLTLTTPDGATRTLTPSGEGRELLFAETTRHGVYRVTAGTNDVRFAVNLLDSNESNLTPRDELPLGRYAKVSAAAAVKANMEVWRWAAAAGLLVLLFEWWFYHRRTA